MKFVRCIQGVSIFIIFIIKFFAICKVYTRDNINVALLKLEVVKKKKKTKNNVYEISSDILVYGEFSTP